MARPRKHDPDTVSQQIMETFWKKGYDATAISDLMAATGLKKGSLYHAFGDKQKMFQMALLRYDQEKVTSLAQAMDELSGSEAISLLLQAPAQAVEASDRRGCLLCNSVGEYESLDDVTRGIVRRTREVFERAIQRALQRITSPSTTIRPSEVQALYFGMQVMARGGVSAEEINAIGQSALARI